MSELSSLGALNLTETCFFRTNVKALLDDESHDRSTLGKILRHMRLKLRWFWVNISMIVQQMFQPQSATSFVARVVKGLAETFHFR